MQTSHSTGGSIAIRGWDATTLLVGLSTLWFRRFLYKTRQPHAPGPHLVFVITVDSWSLCDVKNRIIQGFNFNYSSYQGLPLRIEILTIWSLSRWSQQSSDNIWSLWVVHTRSVHTANLGDKSIYWYCRLKEARRLCQDHCTPNLK